MGLMYLGIKDSPYAMPFDRCKKIAGGMILANILLLFLFLNSTPMTNPLIEDPSLTIYRTTSILFFFGVWVLYPVTFMFISRRCFNWYGPPVNTVVLGTAATGLYAAYKGRYARL